ncbi:MAG: TatD family hydrolase [Vulcanimicrobiaceae bacterium]
MIVDTHAHLHSEAFDDDRATVFARATDHDVRCILNVGCDMADSARALATARTFGGYASVGIHPHEAKDAPEDLVAAFAPFLADEKIVAIGETGLDYYYNHSPRDAQARVLRAQLAIARKEDLPVIFHQRDAYDDFLTILRQEWTPAMRGVIHCFTGDTTQARVFTEEFGLYLGIGGVYTFKTAQATRDAVAAVGLCHIVLETDAPYLAPIPFRGKRNESAYITHTAERIAQELGSTPSAVITATTANATTLFGLP